MEKTGLGYSENGKNPVSTVNSMEKNPVSAVPEAGCWYEEVGRLFGGLKPLDRRNF